MLARGLAYLEKTPPPVSGDMIISLQIVGELTGDPRPKALAEKRRAHIDRDDQRYARLFEVGKAPLASGSLEGVRPSQTEPDPAAPRARLEDGRTVASVCIADAVGCKADARCREFVTARDRWGYELTHQALWLMVWRWMSCPPDARAAARRRPIAASLVKESRADPAFSDLAVERVAFVSHLGFADAVDSAELRRIVAAQLPAGCWPKAPKGRCDTHTTSLALWALAHAKRAGRL